MKKFKSVADVKKMYDEKSTTTAHVSISEVDKAEAELASLLKKLPAKYRDEVDMIAGKIAYAYEKQGFVYAVSVLKKIKRKRGKQ